MRTGVVLRLWGMGYHFVVLRRMMNLATGCWGHSTLLHELGHAFGLIHEHQRPDRDQYISVLEDNVERGFLGMQVAVNFAPQEAQLQTAYDFTSIMHYDRKAFSANGLDTIVPKPAHARWIDIMGNADRLSQLDGQVVSALYGKPTP